MINITLHPAKVAVEARRSTTLKKMIVKAPTWWDRNIKVPTKTKSGDGDDLLPLWVNSTLPSSDAPLT